MKVVMTGAAGGVGTMIRSHLRPHFDRLVLSDLVEIADLERNESFVQADMTDLAAMERLLRGRRRPDPSRRLLGRGAVGCDPERQHHRPLQRLRGGAPPGLPAHRLRHHQPRRGLLPAPAHDRPHRDAAARLALWRQQGVRRGARPHVRRQARPARPQHPHRQCRPQAGRPAPPVDLDQPARPRPAHADRPRASRHPLRGRLRRLAQRPRLVRQQQRLSPRLPARGPVARTTPRRRPTKDAAVSPDPVAEQFQGGPFCSIEFTGDVKRTT